MHTLSLHDALPICQGLSPDQRKHIEIQRGFPKLQLLEGKAHQDSILRDNGVTVEMQANAELAAAVEHNGETAEEHQLTDEEVAHDDFLPEQWQGRCPFCEGA